MIREIPKDKYKRVSIGENIEATGYIECLRKPHGLPWG